MAVFVLDLIRWFDGQRSEPSSLAHCFVVGVEYVSTAVEDGFAREQIQPVVLWYSSRQAAKALSPNRLEWILDLRSWTRLKL